MRRQNLYLFYFENKFNLRGIVYLQKLTPVNLVTISSYPISFQQHIFFWKKTYLHRNNPLLIIFILQIV